MTHIEERLSRSSPGMTALYGGLVAFALYSCMYAYRKAFAAASFEGIQFAGIGFKSSLVIAQVLGYTLSKFIGIKVISSMDTSRRWLYILVFISISWVALFFLPVLPPRLGVVCLFLNGLPLGMIWGLVFSYLEGRKTTEVMGAMLSASFIFSSGMVKSVGKWLMNTFDIDQLWMPFATGAIFFIPLLLLLYLIEQLPRPTHDDMALRTKRVPMTSADRREFVMRILPGLILLVLIYMVLTVIRDLRDNFAAEIWAENGLAESASIFTYAEIPATLFVLGIMASLVLVKSNALALKFNFLLIFLGLFFTVAGSILFSAGHINALTWMIALGVSLYMSYVPFNCILFERLIAAFRSRGNSGFAIYIVDAFGYLATVGILLYKELGTGEILWTPFLLNISTWMAAAGAVMILVAAWYFNGKLVKHA